jgi:hypothetical protein
MIITLVEQAPNLNAMRSIEPDVVYGVTDARSVEIRHTFRGAVTR